MTTLASRRITRFKGALQQHTPAFHRGQSTDFTVPPYGSPDATTASRLQRKTPRPQRPAHTHNIAIPMGNGSFLERLMELRDFMKANGPIAGLEPGAVMPNVARTCLFRFGQVNIDGYRPNRSPLLDQPSYQLSQVEEALEKARARIILDIDKNALEYTWGTLSPAIPFFKDGPKKVFDPAAVRVLHLRTQLGPAWDNIKKLRVIVFEELESAGIKNSKILETQSVYLSIVSMKWVESDRDYSNQTKRFNIKTLYTIPGFGKYRTKPLPAKDEILGRFTPVDLGTSRINSFVLEEIGEEYKQISTDPTITKTFEFA